MVHAAVGEEITADAGTDAAFAWSGAQIGIMGAHAARHALELRLVDAVIPSSAARSRVVSALRAASGG